MSLYNLVMGIHPFAKTYLAVLLGETGPRVLAAIPRFRDAFMKDGKIVILTRTGGDNRPSYEEGNAFLRAIPGFIKDEDDKFDNTFAWFWYEVPDIEVARDVIAKAQALLDATGGDKPRGPEAMVERATAAMNPGADPADPDVARARDAAQKMIDALTSAPSGDVITIGDDGVKVETKH